MSGQPPPPLSTDLRRMLLPGHFSHGEHSQARKYEEYAYVLDFTPRGKSITVRGREGVIIQAIGEERLTLLELLGIPNAMVEVGDRLYIGREGREKVSSVLGRLEYNGHFTDCKERATKHSRKSSGCQRKALCQLHQHGTADNSKDTCTGAYTGYR